MFKIIVSKIPLKYKLIIFKKGIEINKKQKALIAYYLSINEANKNMFIINLALLFYNINLLYLKN